MAKFAANTTVSVAKSQAEIQTTLQRYGADQYAYAEDTGRGVASIQFRAQDRHVRFILNLPPIDSEEFWFTANGRERSQDLATKSWEQACRQRWRALALCIKAKLEAVEAGISEFEEEFMAHIVLPNGGTVGQLMKPQIEQAYISGGVPQGIAGLLPEPSQSAD